MQGFFGEARKPAKFRGQTRSNHHSKIEHSGLCVTGLCVRRDWYFEEAAC